ncbi:MAG: 50S ribosomal protein L10 [Pseudomonadales bacterium]|nr:50S ribosomal protein L10 [Pseudomonadales bacterium]
MALRLEQKQQIVAEVKEIAASALSAVVADYRGLTVAEMTEMRAKARETGVYLRVVRNTLVKRAVEGTDYACLYDTFVGPTLVAFSQEDPGSAARLLKDYAKEHEALEVRALAIGGELLTADQIDLVATLPTLDGARSMLLSVMLAPITKLARTMNEVPSKVTRAVAAIRDQKEAEA